MFINQVDDVHELESGAAQNPPRAWNGPRAGLWTPLSETLDQIFNCKHNAVKFLGNIIYNLFLSKIS